MSKYYRWWFFWNKAYEIPEEATGSFDTFFKIDYEPETQCEVGVRNFKGIYDNIYYYDGDLVKIRSYHEKNHKNDGAFRLVKRSSAYSVLEEIYVSFKLAAFNVINLNDKYEVKIHCIFNAEYKLQQYTEYFYDEAGVINKEKVFIPSVWTIHEEDSEG